MRAWNRSLPIRSTSLAAALLASNAALAVGSGCATAPAPVAACRTVHGRLWLTNGRWGAVIQVDGTKQFLDIRDDDKSLLLVPANVHLDFHDDTEAQGDFTVCPLALPHGR